MTHAYKTISVLGASITNGYFDDEQLGWPYRVVQKLQQDRPHGFYIRNFAVSGDRIVNCLERFRSQVVSNPGDALIIACGTNDLARWGSREAPNSLSLSLRVETWVKLLTEAQRLFCNIYVLSVLPVREDRVPARQNDEGEDQYYRNDDIAAYNATIKALCARFSCRFIDITATLDPKAWRDCLFDDVHPNAQGHALIADTVYAQIKGDLI